MQPHYIDDFDNIEEKQGKCCWAGCYEHGAHPAPKSPDNLHERYHFCLEHIRRYNKSWNYFKNMSDEQAEAYYIDSISGHRPTYKRAEDFKRYKAEDLREEVFREFRFGGHSANQKKHKAIPPEEARALKTLGLFAPVTMADIKKKYKELAKRYHPDVNGGAESEELKAINQAYSYLKNCKAYI